MLLLNKRGKIVRKLLELQDGQGLVEYALILVLISVATIAVMTTVGTDIVAVFNSIIAALT